MSYHGVLSALHQLILVRDDIPKDIEQRLEWIKSELKDLTVEEAQDLARMEPSQIAIYTTSIFSQQTKLLMNKYPATFAVIRFYFDELFGCKFSRVVFARQLSSKFPWRSSRTSELVENCLRFIQSDLCQRLDGIGWLGDMATSEHIAYCLMSRNTKIKESLDNLGDLSSLTVGELMDREFVVGDRFAQLSSEYDFLVTLNELRRRGPFNTNLIPSKSSTAYLISCSRKHSVHWLKVSDLERSFWQNVEPLEVLQIGLLAEAIVADFDSSHSEEEKLKAFLARLSHFSEVGLVSIY